MQYEPARRQTTDNPAARDARAARAWRAAAFTIVEIMVVVVCVAIAAAIILPAVVDPSPTKLRGATEMLIADLEFAQTQSLARGDDPRVVHVDADGGGYSIRTKSDPLTPVKNPVGNGSYVTRFGAGRAAPLSRVTISAYALGGDDRLGFGAAGQLDQSAAASITLSCGGSSIVVTLDPVTGEATAGAIQ